MSSAQPVADGRPGVVINEHVADSGGLRLRGSSASCAGSDDDRNGGEDNDNE